MSESPYNGFDKRDIILRDWLAIDRTILANERTYLSYIRTALTLFIGGISFIKFFDITLVKITGWIFMPVGVIVFIVGSIKYFNMKKEMKRLKMKER